MPKLSTLSIVLQQSLVQAFEPEKVKKLRAIKELLNKMMPGKVDKVLSDIITVACKTEESEPSIDQVLPHMLSVLPNFAKLVL